MNRRWWIRRRCGSRCRSRRGRSGTWQRCWQLPRRPPRHSHAARQRCTGQRPAHLRGARAHPRRQQSHRGGRRKRFPGRSLQLRDLNTQQHQCRKARNLHLMLAFVGAPAVGGLLAGAFGSGVPIAIDAATFAAVTVAAALVRTRRIPRTRVRPTRRAGSVADWPSSGPTGSSPPCSPASPSSSCWSGWSTSSPSTWSANPARRRRLVRRHRSLLDGGHGRRLVGAGLARTQARQIRATTAGAALACAGVAAFAIAPTAVVLVPLAMLGGIGNGYAGTCLSTLPWPAPPTAPAAASPPPPTRSSVALGRLAPARRCRGGDTVTPSDLRHRRSPRAGRRRDRRGHECTPNPRVDTN